MPASQLKRLKASLREQGITGQQQQRSKNKQNTHKDTAATQKARRNAALQQIRESFNPFEYKTAANTGRPEKFVSASHANPTGKSGRYKEVLHRPGVTKSHGEEMRRATLLPELRRRNKVGGVVDRRIGEGDTDMTPEERAAMRFAREKENKRKGVSLFDLEGSDDEGQAGRLTHGGRGITDLEADDFGEEMDSGSENGSDEGLFRRKRARENVEVEVSDFEHGQSAEEEEPERKKTKKEVMQEVIAKSKLHKYERQKAKEDDDDIRQALDQGMADVLALLQGVKRPPPSKDPAISTNGTNGSINPDRQKLLNGFDRAQVDKEYDTRLKQLAQDARAKPSDRSMTVEEKAAADAARLRVLEEKRLKRMEGGEDSQDEQERRSDAADNDEEEFVDETMPFGLSAPEQRRKADAPLVLDDEDEFALDDDLIASDSDDESLSDIESSAGSSDDSDEEDQERVRQSSDDDEFVKDILGADVAATSAKSSGDDTLGKEPGLAYSYPCPHSHEELLGIVGGVAPDQLITIVQRIRALYHPSLSSTNKEAMADFSEALVDHLAWMGNEKQPLSVIEQLIRHIHSLSRAYPIRIGEAFRKHLATLHRSGQPTRGDMAILTAIGAIYPTSDHWHQVVTPAITLMARWLDLNAPARESEPSAAMLRIGAFFVALCIRFQTLSKRYLPEAIRFLARVLASAKQHPSIGTTAHVENLLALADMYTEKSAFIQIFTQFLPLLKGLNERKPHARLTLLLSRSRMKTRPLELHHHRPLPIRTSVPKFEESFNPDKHYDPDKERSDARKLQKEYKRERKGALRELRKDANFIAREQLREKRTRDEAYEKKYRQIIADIQNN